MSQGSIHIEEGQNIGHRDFLFLIKKVNEVSGRSEKNLEATMNLSITSKSPIKFLIERENHDSGFKSMV